MAVKTITIDMEAYDLLSSHKQDGQSFSQVIKKHFGPQPTAGRFLQRLRSSAISDTALRAMDKVVRDRRRDPARAVPR